MYVLRRLTVPVFILSCALALSATALAWPVRQGDDYSFTYNHNRQAAVCDMERDATNVYVKYQRYGFGYNYRAYDGNGALRGCGNSRFGRVGIFKHATCEDRRLWPDACRVSYHT
jgi:hypothetical protein